MTSAQQSEDQAEDSAHVQRIADRSRREAIIRDLYSLAAFYVANPGHPLPTGIQIIHYVAGAPAVQAVADEFTGGHIYGTVQLQCDFRLPETSVPIVMLTADRGPDRPL